MKRLTLVYTLLGFAALAAPLASLEAQGRGRGGGEQESDRDTIPSRYRPPAGMCRIWLKDVPPSQQPAPTDCASAVRNRPRDGRVIFGPEPPRSKMLPERNEKQPPRRAEPPVPIPTKTIPPRRVPPA